MAQSLSSDRGAVAVEFALIFTLVLAPILLGIIQFGRGYNIQDTVSAAAREGVRSFAITNSSSSATAAATRTLTASGITGATIAVSVVDATGAAVTPVSCSAGNNAKVTVTYPFAAISAYFPSLTLTGKGVMLCGG
jgi:Flp pilus assembly protein TadG